MVGHLTPTFYVKMYKRKAGQNMKIAVKEEHNFFLFQDLVEFFILVLKHRWRLPISNNYLGSKYPFAVLHITFTTLGTNYLQKRFLNPNIQS